MGKIGADNAVDCLLVFKADQQQVSLCAQDLAVRSWLFKSWPCLILGHLIA